MADDLKRISAMISAEIGARPEQAAAAIKLLDEGSTVPFIARYRKEATGGLDDTQLRLLAERLVYLRELDARRAAILESIRSQGKLTDELETQDRRRRSPRPSSRTSISPTSRSAAPRRKSRASAASGRSPRRSSPTARTTPAELAAAYVTGEVADVKAALEGARDIVAETISGQRRPARPAARLYAGARPFLRAQGRRGQAGGGREILRLFRSCRALGERAEPSRARDAARPQRGRADRSTSRSTPTMPRRRQAGRAHDRRGLSGRRAGAGRSLVDGGRALDLAGQALDSRSRSI